MHDQRANADVALQLITLLGDTLARVRAVCAKEEYALSQIVSSLNFVNHTVDTWVSSSSQEEEDEAGGESSQLHDAVSGSIDAVLGEARLIRGSSKRTANSEASKAKATDEQRMKGTTMERFSMRPRKAISSDHGDRHPSFQAAHEKLLSWMESKTQKSFPIVARHRHEDSVERASIAASKFVDSLWTIHGNPAASETKVHDAVVSSDDGSSTLPTLKQVEAATQKNVEELQALRKQMEQRHLQFELHHSHLTISNAVPLVQHVDNEKEVVSENSSWLPATVCWKVLGTQVKGFMMEHEMKKTLYSHIQQPLAVMRLVHSIHTNIFHCHLQSVLAQCCLLKSSSPSSRRNQDMLSSSSVYMCIRLAHCLVCKDGKALFTVARRVDIA